MDLQIHQNFQKTGNFIYQETLNQHQNINKIYSQSINTIRVHSYFNEERDEVELISALMRFGRDGAVVALDYMMGLKECLKSIFSDNTLNQTMR